MNDQATDDVRVLVVIVNYRSARLTLDCLRTLEAERRQLPNLQVIVVENASGDGQVLTESLTTAPYRDWVHVVETGFNGGFAYGCNRGIENADERGIAAEFVLLLNPDTRVHPSAVRLLTCFLREHPEVGIVGSGLDLADGTNWPIAFRFPSVWSEIERGMGIGVVSRLLRRYAVAQRMADVAAQIDWVPGASMMIRREVLDQVGGLDEGFFLYFEETDFCRRARSIGWTCWYVPQSRVLHVAGQSSGLTAHDRKPEPVPDYWFESRRRYFLKHHGAGYTMVADLAFLASSLVGRLKKWIVPSGRPTPPRFLRDFLRHSTLWRRNRRVAAETIDCPAAARESVH